LEFKTNSVIFEDGSEENIDSVLLCTGYKNTQQNMLPLETEEWPLFCEFFYIDDPTLCLNGVPEGPF